MRISAQCACKMCDTSYAKATLTLNITVSYFRGIVVLLVLYLYVCNGENVCVSTS